MRKKSLELGRRGVFEAHPPGMSEGEGVCNDMAERSRAGPDGVSSDHPATPANRWRVGPRAGRMTEISR